MDNLTPEQIRQIIELGELSEEDKMLLTQYEAAQKLRDRQAPGMTYAGKMVYANPIQSIVGGVQNYRAGKEQAGLREQMERNRDARVDARETFFNAQAGRGPSSTPTMPAPTVNPGMPDISMQQDPRVQMALAQALRQMQPPKKPQAPPSSAPAPGIRAAPPAQPWQPIPGELPTLPR